MSTLPKVSDIQRVVADAWEISVREMKDETRAYRVSRPRQVAMYLSCRLTTQSLHQIGSSFSRDHTTVIHARRVVTERRKADPALDRTIRQIADQLTGAA